MKKYDGDKHDVSADREELAVRNVDHVEHAEDQGQPRREHGIDAAQDNAQNEELENQLKHCSGGLRSR